MNIDWVHQTADPLFRDLSRNDRYLLYLHFARDMEAVQIADSFCWTANDVRRRLTFLLETVHGLIEGCPADTEIIDSLAA